MRVHPLGICQPGKVPLPAPSCPGFRQPRGTGRSLPVLVAAMSSSTLTSDGAAWLASAGTYPRSTLAFWEERPDAPVVLPCGSAFDVVSAPAIFGRRMLDRLWDDGPGSGPVAVFRGRMLLFAAPGTAQRLPSLLEWEEWGSAGAGPPGRTAAVPPLLCHGTGDAVTVPAPAPTDPEAASGSRWLVAPDTLDPWLPGPEILLWAAVRAARPAVRISIFPPRDQGAKVYDVSRRR
ncbi:bifunctional DNA primase/polymerase [Streptomyces sp. NPDC047706]|uniref:bifunctional DNA primase/polymerase n=1 Tax=Streptomyces sp. NPDC047706 TaxID=3365486 RepID=UPI00371A78DD